VQQVLVESALIAIPACALGLLFAVAAAPAVVSMTATASDPIRLDLHVGWRLIAAGFVLTAAATTLFGLVPAIRATAINPGTLLKADGAGAGSRTRALRPFVALQTATGTMVVFVGALLVMSFARLSAVEPGFAGDVLLVSLETAPRIEPARQREAVLDVLDRVRGVPGVQTVSASESSPLGRSWTSNMPVPGKADAFVDATVQQVSAGYFETMRIPIVAGRGFDARDLADPDSHALVVNEAFARAYFGGARAIGQTLRKRFFEKSLVYQIVGVAGDTRYDLRKAPAPTIYVRLSMRSNVTLQVRTAGNRPLIARIRDEVRGAGPVFRITAVRTEADAIAETLLRERLLALLAGFFGVVGLALAAVGLFGVLSYTVAQRTREIGIRAALGARPLHAVRLITVDAGAPVLAGAAAGLALGVYLSRFVVSLLYDVRPLAVSSVGWPVAALVGVAILAAALPLRRALQLSPAEALRDTL
jgi:predicted permease